MAPEPASPAAPATARSGVHPVIALEGIGPVFADKLQKQGIRDTAQLLAGDAAALAGQVGAPVATVRHWQAMADLVRVAGIGPQYAEALVRSGVTSTADLLRRDPAELTRQVTAYLASLKTKVLGQPVTEPRIQAWQQAARGVLTRARP
ncbi:MAG TPA: DUF4332 domain-containing protein, partial [Candidatus Thermoplasmatota archaeon]|nr:DUF4332 domain-containing protein [Candidatus Thermoplasmatota archaeon]